MAHSNDFLHSLLFFAILNPKKSPTNEQRQSGILYVSSSITNKHMGSRKKTTKRLSRIHSHFENRVSLIISVWNALHKISKVLTDTL